MCKFTVVRRPSDRTRMGREHRNNSNHDTESKTKTGFVVAVNARALDIIPNIFFFSEQGAQ